MKTKTSTRRYRQNARADAAKATAERILSAFMTRLSSEWFDAITLESVANDAGVTVQTVVRRFGGKEGLLEAARGKLALEVKQRRSTTPGDIDKAIDQLIGDYEAIGDFVIRLLAQEDRYPVIRTITNHGRKQHRDWLSEVFSPQLTSAKGALRQRRLDMLVAASDVYIWKLVRIDMKRPVTHYRTMLKSLINGALLDKCAQVSQG